MIDIRTRLYLLKRLKEGGYSGSYVEAISNAKEWVQRMQTGGEVGGDYPPRRSVSDFVNSISGGYNNMPSDRLVNNQSNELKRIQVIEEAERLKHVEAMQPKDKIELPVGTRMGNLAMANLTNVRGNEQLEAYTRMQMPRSVAEELGYTALFGGIGKVLKGGYNVGKGIGNIAKKEYQYFKDPKKYVENLQNIVTERKQIDDWDVFKHRDKLWNKRKEIEYNNYLPSRNAINNKFSPRLDEIKKEWDTILWKEEKKINSKHLTTEQVSKRIQYRVNHASRSESNSDFDRKIIFNQEKFIKDRHNNVKKPVGDYILIRDNIIPSDVNVFLKNLGMKPIKTVEDFEKLPKRYKNAYFAKQTRLTRGVTNINEGEDNIKALNTIDKNITGTGGRMDALPGVDAIYASNSPDLADAFAKGWIGGFTGDIVDEPLRKLTKDADLAKFVKLHKKRYKGTYYDKDDAIRYAYYRGDAHQFIIPEKIVKELKLTNVKYRDPNFDYYKGRWGEEAKKSWRYIDPYPDSGKTEAIVRYNRQHVKSAKEEYLDIKKNIDAKYIEKGNEVSIKMDRYLNKVHDKRIRNEKLHNKKVKKETIESDIYWEDLIRKNRKFKSIYNKSKNISFAVGLPGAAVGVYPFLKEVTDKQWAKKLEEFDRLEKEKKDYKDYVKKRKRESYKMKSK